MGSFLRRVLTSCSITRDCLRSLLLETTVLRPASSLKTKEPESAQAGPNERHLTGAPTPPGNLLREPVSWDWPLVYLARLVRCPEAGDRQEMAVLAALETPEEVASLPDLLHLWVEKTERSACWRPLCSGTLAGLADRNPEATEERRAPLDAVYTALPQRGRPSKALGHWHQEVLTEDYPGRMTVRRSVFIPPPPPGVQRLLQNFGEYEKWRSLNEELEHNWEYSAQQPLLITSTSSEEER